MNAIEKLARRFDAESDGAKVLAGRYPRLEEQYEAESRAWRLAAGELRRLLCKECKGDGIIQIETYLGDVRVVCDDCAGSGQTPDESAKIET